MRGVRLKYGKWLVQSHTLARTSHVLLASSSTTITAFLSEYTTVTRPLENVRFNLSHPSKLLGFICLHLILSVTVLQ